MFKGAFTHGSGYAQTRGGKLNKLRKFMHQVRADFYLYGHMHDIIIETMPVLESDKVCRLKDTTAIGAVTGCYFRTYTQGVAPSYGELRNMDPVVIGSPVVLFDPTNNFVTIQDTRNPKYSYGEVQYQETMTLK